jgi:VWFA-related protein
MAKPLIRLKALLALFLILFAGAAVRLASQNVSDDEIRWGSRPYSLPSANSIHVQTNIVQVPVVVRDSNGKAVAGRKQSDFTLTDEGHPVKIASFIVENSPASPIAAPQAPRIIDASLPPEAVVTPMNPPPPPTRYIALFFDDTSMRMLDVAMARKAAESFVRTSLKPGDKIGIFTTSTTVTLNFTDDVPKLLDTLAQLLSHRRNAASGTTCAMNPYQAYLIMQTYDVRSDALDLGMAEPGCGGKSVHDVIAIATNMLGLAEQFSQDTMGIITDVIHYLGRMPGHRMLVLASSGFLTETLGEKQDKVIDEALTANVIINSIDAKGLVAEIPNYDEDGRPVGLSGKMGSLYDQFKTQNREVQNDPLAILAEGTGGKFYHNRNDLDVGLKQLAAAPDVSYVLTFSPGDLKRNGATHTLKVKVANSHGMTITARRGYVAPGPNLTPPEKKKVQLDGAVTGTDIQTRLLAQLSTDIGHSAAGEPTLKVAIHVDANKLPYQTQGDRKVERLIFITALFDQQNHFLTGVQGVMDLRLKPETMSSISTQGLDAKLSVQAAPGNYRLRQVIQEVGDGRITTINRNVTIQ